MECGSVFKWRYRMTYSGGIWRLVCRMPKRWGVETPEES
jgi:hypothetical protein